MTWDKTPSMKDAVKAFIVLDGNSKTDLAKTESRFHDYLIKYNAGQEAETGLIEECMTDLFDTYKGALLNLDFVLSQTVQRMVKRNADLASPTLFNTLSARVEEYLHENCDQPAVEAKGDKPAREAITDRTYGMRKGKGGGFYKKSDYTPKA